VAGLGQASGLAGVIAGFCELTAFLLGVAGWVGKRRAASASEDIPDAAATRTPPVKVSSTSNTETEKSAKYVVDARGARVLQIGDRNAQYNDFPRGAPDRWQSGSADEL